MDIEDPKHVINTKINSLRDRLLDLTLRNPRLSTKFSEKSNSIIRIVDEIPDFILKSLTEKRMHIVPLPSLDVDPKDELSQDFQDALIEARQNDTEYLSELDKIEQGSEDSIDKEEQAIRALKDRIRNILGMPPRQTKSTLSLQEHAKNNHINPNYDLPRMDEEHADGRHSDKDIQTLLLPEHLERRLNGLINKARSWRDEAGLNVLYAAFGFLEWSESNTTTTSYAPLVLLPVQLEKERSRKGLEYFASGIESNPEGNSTLVEKFLEGIKIPEYSNDQYLDKYFDLIEEIKPNMMKIWRVRRWVAFGVFPSSRVSMYHDLDPNAWDYASHGVIPTIFGNKVQNDSISPFSNEYDVDNPEIESIVPLIVKEADSSQFSAVVDVMKQNNTAIEGPPGTGKSQTIVNMIAAALAKGKKVLFVAEKMAALEVVRSRLEECNLGEFLLTLQPNRSSKIQVIESLRSRLKMEIKPNSKDLDAEIIEIKKIRSNLQNYIAALNASFGNSTAYEVLWRSISLKNEISNLPPSLRDFHIPEIRNEVAKQNSDTDILLERLEHAWKNSRNTQLALHDLDLRYKTYQIDDILTATNDVAKAIENLYLVNSDNSIPYFPKDMTLQSFKSYIQLSEKLTVDKILEDTELVLKLSKVNNQEICKFVEKLQDLAYQKMSLEIEISSPLEKQTIEKLKDLITFQEKYQLNTLTDQIIENDLEENILINDVRNFYNDVIKIWPPFEEHSLGEIIEVCDLLFETDREILNKNKIQYRNTENLEYIRNRIKSINKLHSIREELSSKDYPPFNELDLVEEYDRILEESHLLSVFYPEYRQAKRYFEEHIDSATTDLEMLANLQNTNNPKYILKTWLGGMRRFRSDKKLFNLLGSNYEDINANFNIYSKVLQYIEIIETKFSEKERLRNFLYTLNSNDIQGLPNLSRDSTLRSKQYETISLSQFRDKIANQSHQSEIKHIKDILNVFQDRELKSLNELRSLLNKIQSFQSEVENFIQIEDFKDFENELLKHLKPVNDAVDRLASLANTSREYWINEGTLESYAKSLSELSKDRDGLEAYIEFCGIKYEASKAGLENFIKYAIPQVDTHGNSLHQLYTATIMDKAIKEIYEEHGSVLSYFNGETLTSLRAKFVSLDKEIIKLSREKLRGFLYNEGQSKVHRGFSSPRVGELTELALINHEISKSSRFIPTRSLTERAGKSLLELKPCWMMSPLAVAQYVDKRKIAFDLVIIDEASQMTPENAIGALIRGKQAVVVGDPKQLPPTNFFRTAITDDDNNDGDSDPSNSILDFANATFECHRTLRWHYRSRHSSLIDFSNYHIYSKSLIIFPNPDEERSKMGVFYKKVDGLYISGTSSSSGTNIKEAEAMVEAAIDHMANNSDLSLGMVALNLKQRELLQELMDNAAAQNTYVATYIEKWETENDGLQSFFIKNLESVQGDERDVIFIGTVYGPETPGAKVMQRFGPISGSTGNRRLNVLFTRAKRKIVTFSSMTSSDIQPKNDNPGVTMLKDWLEYCAKGGKVLHTGVSTNREPDSPFEQYVAKQLESLGCEAVPQVGVSGYFIDIGVKHPDWPHGYILGVECDGATYHSAKSARDRDRLRQEILEGLGWHLYRIWSIDWFNNPLKEVEKLKAAIDQRLKTLNT